MKKSLIAILLPCIIATGSSVSAQIIKEAGLRLKTNEIKTAFHRHLTEYTGECPGREWSGPGASGAIRFISSIIPPAKGLRVELVSLSTSNNLTKKYQNVEKGSSSFSLRKLGRTDGEHTVEYKIFNKKTDQVLEKGDFSYSITSSTSTMDRSAEWKPETYCASNGKDSTKDCETVGSRLRKYCSGIDTGTTRGDTGIIH